MVTKNAKSKNRSSSRKARSQSKPRSTESRSRIFEDVIGLVDTLLRSRKADGVDKLNAIAEATREYAASIPNLPTISEQVHLASESMEDFADYMIHSNAEQMIQDAGNFARRRPLATLCVSMAAGLAATRMLMPNRRTSDMPQKKRGDGQKKTAVKRPRNNGTEHLHA